MLSSSFTPGMDKPSREDLSRRKMSCLAKKERMLQIVPWYRVASPPLKTVILDGVVSATCYARKCAVRLLSHPKELNLTIQRSCPLHYGPGRSLPFGGEEARPHLTQDPPAIPTCQSGSTLLPVRCQDPTHLPSREGNSVAASCIVRSAHKSRLRTTNRFCSWVFRVSVSCICGHFRLHTSPAHS